MRSYSNKKRYFVWLPLWIALGIVLGIFIGSRFAAFQSTKSLFRGGSKIDAILQYVNEAYVDSVNTQELIEKALPGLIAELDPHSTYFSAKDMELVGDELEGHFSGIGVQFVLRNDTITVVTVIQGGPSQAAGILPGDRIVNVNDSLFAGKEMTNEKVMRSLRGPKGSDVKLGIKRFGKSELVNITVTRGDIPVNTVDIAYQPVPKIGLIKVNKFGNTTVKEFITAISKLKSQGTNSFIVDLRQNTGGSLAAAIQMVNEFLGKGQLIVYTEGRAYPREDALADGSGTTKTDQLVVLIDEGSASASEVFAGAIQDNDRGLIIGRRSFGKGLVQNQQVFKDGSALRLTIARYHTPSGRCVQKPYELGKSSDYNQDLMNRYLRGEFDSQDSIKQAGEPLFHTVAGRPVYGNGGIMPDIFIPRDTIGVNSYYISVANNGLIYESAFLYTDKNRQRLESFKTWEELDAYLSYQPLVQNLVSLAENKGIRNRPYLVSESRSLLMIQLKANIVRNIFGDEGFYSIILKDDIVLKKAIELMQAGKAQPGMIRSGGYKK
ncbi:S41 family peptidase [Dysgonomonas macrotermitis]|uniref:Carboxyl-terminal processing protease n=1 Tax=Dysgonomonas macrotermitis TaxID=1346286 RepID=A0A1M5ILM8_9BACT|nr:S41 family peptidase [Dysgonomonas macrotermitis]SHG29171.1 carboxyl-terminal processing protease [Dysgonomonas macrotermitis]